MQKKALNFFLHLIYYGTADRQTTGGYTKIANVISADFRLLGQLKSGDRVRFEKVSLAAAQEALLAQRASLRLLRHVLDG